MALSLRALTVHDQTLLWQMLQIAAHETNLDAVKTQPALAMYAENWGRNGDSGIAACWDETVVGAAWLRLWTAEIYGFGFIDTRTPELALAVVPEFQNRGIGTRLLAQVLAETKLRHAAISLNVRADNAARRLYERAGFVTVSGSEIINRTGGVSLNMIYRFESE